MAILKDKQEVTTADLSCTLKYLIEIYNEEVGRANAIIDDHNKAVLVEEHDFPHEDNT